MAYKIGFCPCCDQQIMVQDTNGQWNSYKQNFRQADLIYENGHRMRTIICADCFQEKPDFTKLIDAITHKESEACDKGLSDKIKERGLPISIELAARAKQGIRIGARNVG